MRCPVEEREKLWRKCNSRLKHKKSRAPDSVRDIKIQHHTDLRGHCGLLGQMFVIILKLLSLCRDGKLLQSEKYGEFLFLFMTLAFIEDAAFKDLTTEGL